MSAIIARPRRARDIAAARAAAMAELSDGLFTGLVFAVVAAYFCVSDMVLTNIGINYAEGGGNPLEKIHPGTWLAFTALLLMGLRRGNPLRLIDVVAAFRGVALFMLAWSMLCVWVIAITKVPFTPLVDTFLAAIVVCLLISELEPPAMRKLALMVHALMTINACVGVVEYATGWRLTPYTIGSTAIDTDWRSTAILGHPLGNAALTGSYVVALTVGGARDLPRWLRPLALALQLVAMIAFGGRSSLANALVMISGVGIWRLSRLTRGQSFDKVAAATVFLVAPVVVALVAAASIGGFFTQFVERLSDDAGSGKTRLIMLTFFDMIPLRDIVFGPDSAYVASLQAQEGIELGIESFFVGFVLAHGALMASVFFLGLFAFCWQIARQTRPSTWLVLLFYFIVASTSVSLSVKTITFAVFVSMTLSIMRPARMGEAST